MITERHNQSHCYTMKSLKDNFLSLVISVALLIDALTGAPVIGIDYGGEFFKVAMVSHGKPFDILLNGSSLRKTPTVVAFTEKERFTGPEALGRVVKNPSTTFSFVNGLMGYGRGEIPVRKNSSTGRSMGDNGFEERFYPFDVVTDEVRGTVKLRIREEMHMSPEEVAANVFSFIKAMTMDATGLEDRHNELSGKNASQTGRKKETPLSCVITIPCNFTQRQRQAVVDAAELGGLHVLALIPSTVAAAVQHGINMDLSIVGVQETEKKTETKTSKKKLPVSYGSQTMLFYDLGSTRAEASVFKYSMVKPVGKGGKQEILHVEQLSCAAHTGSAGHLADILLAGEMAERFEEKFKVNLSNKPKALKSILRQATRAKHILSTNNQTEVYVESLADGNDLKEKVSREVLEALLEKSGALSDIMDPINKAVKDAGVVFAQQAHDDETLLKLDAVEVVGGGWRMPIVQEHLRKIVEPLELGKRLNGDEAMALGAAFVAANHSSAFKVKQILVSQTAPANYDVDVQPLNNSSGSEPRTYSLFTPSDYFGESRTLTLTDMDNDFMVTVKENSEAFINFSVQGLSDLSVPDAVKGKPSIILTFKVDLRGLLVLDTVQVEVEIENVSDVKESDKNSVKPAVETPDTTNNEGNNTKESDSAKTSSQKDGMENDIKENESNNEPVDVTNNQTTSPTPPENEIRVTTEKPSTIQRNKTKKSIFKLTVTSTPLKPLPMSADDKAAAIARLDSLHEIEREAKVLAVARNSLESYIYAAKEAIQSAENAAEELKTQADSEPPDAELKALREQAGIALVTKPEEREALLETLSIAGDWLDGEEDSMKSENVHEKMASITDIYDPILTRAREMIARPQIIKYATRTLKDAQRKITDYKETRTWISNEHFEVAVKELETFQTWWEEKNQLQSNLTDYETPAYMKAEVKTKGKKVVTAIKQLERIPKPAPPPVAKTDDLKDEKAEPKGSDTQDGKTVSDAQGEAVAKHEVAEELTEAQAKQDQQETAAPEPVEFPKGEEL